MQHATFAVEQFQNNTGNNFFAPTHHKVLNTIANHLMFMYIIIQSVIPPDFVPSSTYTGTFHSVIDSSIAENAATVVHEDRRQVVKSINNNMKSQDDAVQSSDDELEEEEEEKEDEEEEEEDEEEEDGNEDEVEEEEVSSSEYESDEDNNSKAKAPPKIAELVVEQNTALDNVKAIVPRAPLLNKLMTAPNGGIIHNVSPSSKTTANITTPPIAKTPTKRSHEPEDDISAVSKRTKRAPGKQGPALCHEMITRGSSTRVTKYFDTFTPVDKIPTKKGSIRTRNGIPLDVLLSALQKSVRLGAFVEALYLSREVTSLYKAELGEVEVVAGVSGNSSVKAAVTNALHRLLVIFVEDVESGTPQLKNYVCKIVGELIKKRGHKISAAEFERRFASVMYYMAMAPTKGRLYSYVRALKFAMNLPHLKDSASATYNTLARLPCVNLGKLIEIDLTKCADPALFSAENPKAKFADYQQKFNIKEASPNYRLLFNEIPAREKWLAVSSELFNSSLCKLLPLPKTYKLPTAVLTTSFIEDALQNADPGYLNGTKVPTLILSKHIVQDQHTKLGKNLKDSSRFALLGSLVNNNSRVIPQNAIALYIGLKLSKDFIPRHPVDTASDASPTRLNIDTILDNAEAAPAIRNFHRESTLITYEARAQVNTSDYKPDTYFGFMWGHRVFVKGPYVTETLINQLSVLHIVHSLKIHLGLPTVKPWRFNMSLSNLNNDLLKCPVGARNKCHIDPDHDVLGRTKYEFVVTRSLIPDTDEIRKIPTIEYGKVKNVAHTKWDLAKVVDWDTLSKPSSKFKRGIVGCPDFSAMESSEKMNFVIACAWRYCSGTSDPALRNFVWCMYNGHVYSVGEESAFTKPPTQFRFKEAVMQEMRSFVQSNFGEITVTIKRWIDQCATFAQKDSIENFNSFVTNLQSAASSVEDFNVMFNYYINNKNQQ